MKQKRLRLPPVDQYRQPFIEPIGHLAMQAAHAEDELISLCSVIPFDGSPSQLRREDAAHSLRNWNGEAQRFLEDRIALIPDPHHRRQAQDAVDRYIVLREKRHRAIHDAIALGFFGSPGGLGVVETMSVSYIRDKNTKTTEMSMTFTTPEKIADLACELYDVQKDLNAVAYFLNANHK